MSEVLEYSDLFVDGLRMTALVTVLGILLAVTVAFVAGLMRLSRHWLLRAPSYVFIEFFRGTSIVVQLVWVYYALPFMGVRIDSIAAAVLVVGLNEGAYAAEIVRGTISSRPKGQTEACIALGLSPAQRMRRVLIPQSIPAMLPSFGNVFVDLLKATSLVATVGVADLTFNGLSVRTETQESFVVFAMLLVVYFVLSMLLALLTRWLEGRFAIDREQRSSFASLFGGRAGSGVSA